MLNPISLLIGLVPVLVFLAALVTLDSFKLVSLGTLAGAIAGGGAAALLALGLATLVLAPGWITNAEYAIVPGPLFEEMLKGVWIVILIRRRRISFLVEAGITGFAVGAGFALVENLYYQLIVLASPSALIWTIRGCGTAITHGSVTAIFAMLSFDLLERGALPRPFVYLPGLGAAAAIHAAFNLFVLPPVEATITVLVVMPVLLTLAFRHGEQGTRRWLGVGFDTDAELLAAIENGRLAGTPIGAHLEAMTKRFPGTVVADMMCLVRVRLELSLRARGLLLAREAGIFLEPGQEAEAAFREMVHLEKAIGPTGLLALGPFLSRSRRDLWRIYASARGAA